MKRTCSGTNKDGTPCKSSARKGMEQCWRHADSSDAHARSARDERWSREAFLAEFEATMMVRAACRQVGISPTTAYLERQRNEDFAVAWSEIEEHVTERLEAEAFRRAHDGVDRMVVSAGRELGTERQFSDTLMALLLKARRPERYRDNVKVEHGGSVEQRVRVDLSKLSDSQIDQLEEIAERLDA